MIIKPCPECRRAGVLSMEGARWLVRCPGPSCDRGSYTEPSEREAVRKWNNRPKRMGSPEKRKAAVARKAYEALPAGHIDKPEALRVWRYWQARANNPSQNS